WRMRGTDQQQTHVFSYVSPEQRVRKDHPLRPIRSMVDEIPKRLSPQFDKMYAKVGRPSVPPEQLLQAQLLQMLHSVRSERLLMEEMDYNILFRWFVGLDLDDAVWEATVFTKNRDRLLEAEGGQGISRAGSSTGAGKRDGCRMNTSAWTARCWKRGPA
ncbi:MAG: transposase, partial [Candidatus Acidiferrales bacterium]